MTFQWQPSTRAWLYITTVPLLRICIRLYQIIQLHQAVHLWWNYNNGCIAVKEEGKGVAVTYTETCLSQIARFVYKRVCHNATTNGTVSNAHKEIQISTTQKQKNSCTHDNLYQTPHGRQRGTRSYVADEYKRMTNCRGAQLLSKSRRCIVAAHKWIDANVGKTQAAGPTTTSNKMCL